MMIQLNQKDSSEKNHRPNNKKIIQNYISDFIKEKSDDGSNKIERIIIKFFKQINNA